MYIFVAVFLVFLIGCKTVQTDIEIEKNPLITEQIIEKFTIVYTDKGKLKIILAAESAIINENENVAHVILPIIKCYDKGNCISTFSAESAGIDMETYDIKGMGRCVIDSRKNGCVQTTDLAYNAVKDFVYSNNDVKIIRLHETIYGTSFKSDTKLEKIVITNQRTVFD
jgi:LPS export ABC transporter protein LptC